MLSCQYTLTRNTNCRAITTPNAAIGRNKVFQRMLISPSNHCFASHTADKITAQVSTMKIDQGSTTPNAAIGRNKGFQRMLISPSNHCFASHTADKMTAPVSTMKIDQGSTAPNAIGQKINKVNVP